MKRILCLILALFTVLCFAACGGSTTPTPDNGGSQSSNTPVAATDGYVFNYNGTKIAMHADAAPIIAALGEPKSCTEEASCAFTGLDKTYFFTRNESGSYLVTNYTNEDMTRVVETVRLTFVTDQTVSMMVSADTVTPPAVDVPEGAAFLGWATHLTDDDGNVTLQLRLLPDGRILGDPEPMILYPLYDTP